MTVYKPLARSYYNSQTNEGVTDVRPNRENLARARMLYLLGAEREADLAMIAARGMRYVPMAVKDQVREERAVRHWHEHRRGGWTPIDIVLRSPLHETETWYEPRGGRRIPNRTKECPTCVAGVPLVPTDQLVRAEVDGEMKFIPKHLADRIITALDESSREG